MKPALLSLFSLLLISACTPNDGPARTAPPLIFRTQPDPQDGRVKFYFTNKSDKVLHGIRINSNKDGRLLSKIIIDTLEPHKTELVDLAIMGAIISGNWREATITCEDYELPISATQQ